MSTSGAQTYAPHIAKSVRTCAPAWERACCARRLAGGSSTRRPPLPRAGDIGLKPVIVYHNLSVPELYEHALKYEPSTHIVHAGALATLSGAKTGRSPK